MAMRSSGRKTSDATITQRTGALLAGVTLEPAATVCTLAVYDVVLAASKADGKMLALVETNSGEYGTKDWVPCEPIRVNSGIWCDVTGTGAKYVIHYK